VKGGMDKLFELLFHHGGLVHLVVFIVPGFVAWRTYQWRRPQGEQKAADAIVDIVAFSVLSSLLWYKTEWTAWPASGTAAVVFGLQVFVTPVIIALLYQYTVEFSARRSPSACMGLHFQCARVPKKRGWWERALSRGYAQRRR
jgi:hypothetical protein